ncbi:hypothetical protein B0A50_03906 [Salinomyces thailandicus]|uniref:Uncharacterized protein n=1 Tax=Salinomyces thailandicus TaxID=706561 RepID=A0A4V5N4N2_9PEZI|nr:hypothetical protein B0A50_03906 [Salinomyces thailandica]
MARSPSSTHLPTLLTLLLLLFHALPPIAANVNIPFRIDYGTGNLATNRDPNNKGQTEKKRFTQRMQAARAAETESHWSDAYTVNCTSSAYLDAEIYSLQPEKLDPGWSWAADRLDECMRGPYPGDFDGGDNDGKPRVIRVDFDQLPIPVRKWIEEHPEQDPQTWRNWFKSFVMAVNDFCVVDGVVFFAPATLKQYLPLFAVESGEECGGVLTDLRLYGKDVDGLRVGGNLLGKSEIGNTLRVKTIAHVFREKRSANDKTAASQDATDAQEEL